MSKAGPVDVQEVGVSKSLRSRCKKALKRVLGPKVSRLGIAERRAMSVFNGTRRMIMVEMMMIVMLQGFWASD